MRRVKFTLILCCLIFSLTGCGLTFQSPLDDVKDAWEEHKDEKEAEKEAEKAVKQAEYDTLYSDELAEIKDSLYEEGSWIGKAAANVASWFSSKSAAEIYAEHNKKDVDSAVHGKANDKRLDEEARKAEESKERKDHFMKFVPLIIIAVIIVLLVILFIFLSGRSERKVVHVEVAKSEVADTQSTDQVTVKYQRVLRDNCKKLGLDYEQTLAQHGGDAVAAVNATNLQLYKQ